MGFRRGRQRGRIKNRARLRILTGEIEKKLLHAERHARPWRRQRETIYGSESPANPAIRFVNAPIKNYEHVRF